VGFDYRKLSAQDRAAIADAQIVQFEREHYEHKLNLARLESVPQQARTEVDHKQITLAQESMKKLEEAIAVTERERDALPSDS
jgi:hypothetical protein